MGRKQAGSSKPVIIEQVACDYIKVTTFSEDVSREWYAIVDKMALSLPTKAAFSQYSGVSWDEGVSIVEGQQDKGVHYIFSAAGAVAHEALQYMKEWSSEARESLKCTRIDVQITLPPVPDRPSLIELAAAVKKGELGEWQGRGRPIVEGYLGDEGNTLMIGSRVSDVYCRVYDKKVRRRGGVERTYERYEVEFKDSRAANLFIRVMSAGTENIDTPMKEAIKAHIERLPPGLAVYIAAAGLNKWDVLGLMPEYSKPGKDNRTKWVETVGNALARAAQLPGKDGEIVRRVLMNAFATGVHGEGYTDLNSWAIVSPEGTIYSPEGIRYNSHTRSGGVTITDIHHSRITIDTLAGNDISTSPRQRTRALNAQGEKGNGILD